MFSKQILRFSEPLQLYTRYIVHVYVVLIWKIQTTLLSMAEEETQTGTLTNTPTQETSLDRAL